MFHPILPDTEARYRQQHIRAEYIRAQRQVSISGMRQILGNSIIAMGTRIHGMAQGQCTDAAETRGLIRSTLRAV